MTGSVGATCHAHATCVYIYMRLYVYYMVCECCTGLCSRLRNGVWTRCVAGWIQWPLFRTVETPPILMTSELVCTPAIIMHRILSYTPSPFPLPSLPPSSLQLNVLLEVWKQSPYIPTSPNSWLVSIMYISICLSLCTYTLMHTPCTHMLTSCDDIIVLMLVMSVM